MKVALPDPLVAAQLLRLHLAMLVARHRVGAMVGKLSVEPYVKCRDGLGISGSVGHLCATHHVLAIAGDLPRFERLQVVQPRHLIAMNVRRPEKSPFSNWFWISRRCSRKSRTCVVQAAFFAITR